MITIQRFVNHCQVRIEVLRRQGTRRQVQFCQALTFCNGIDIPIQFLLVSRPKINISQQVMIICELYLKNVSQKRQIPQCTFTISHPQVMACLMTMGYSQENRAMQKAMPQIRKVSNPIFQSVIYTLWVFSTTPTCSPLPTPQISIKFWIF